MLITDQFVYVHNPKTGGTFVTEMLYKVALNHEGFGVTEVPGQKHTGRRRIPQEHAAKPVVINVRNPLEHYVSRYEFKWWSEQSVKSKRFSRAEVEQLYPGFPKLKFEEFVRFYCDWRVQKPRKLKKMGDDAIGWNTWKLFQLCLENPLDFAHNFDTMSDKEIRQAFTGVKFLKTESLNADLHALLIDELGPSAEIDFVLPADYILPKKGGRAKSNEWRKYYDKATFDFVMQRDRFIFRMFENYKVSF